MKNIGIALKAIRVSQKDTLEEASKKLKVSAKLLLKVESGMFVSLPFIQQYPAAYELSLTQIFLLAENVEATHLDKQDINSKICNKNIKKIFKEMGKIAQQNKFLDEKKYIPDEVDHIMNESENKAFLSVSMNKATQDKFDRQYGIGNKLTEIIANYFILRISLDEGIDDGLSCLHGCINKEPKLITLNLKTGPVKPHLKIVR
jgi:transcriptional regulator with XRE-family HTH domain